MTKHSTQDKKASRKKIQEGKFIPAEVYYDTYYRAMGYVPKKEFIEKSEMEV